MNPESQSAKADDDKVPYSTTTSLLGWPPARVKTPGSRDKDPHNEWPPSLPPIRSFILALSNWLFMPRRTSLSVRRDTYERKTLQLAPATVD